MQSCGMLKQFDKQLSDLQKVYVSDVVSEQA